MSKRTGIYPFFRNEVRNVEYALLKNHRKASQRITFPIIILLAYASTDDFCCVKFSIAITEARARSRKDEINLEMNDGFCATSSITTAT